MTRERARAEAFRLRRDGPSMAEIGERIDVSSSTTNR